MRTAAIIGLLVGMLGCGDNEATPAAAEAASLSATPDASADADARPTVDASPDACIQAQGNCGCVWFEDYNSATGEIATHVECPDR